MKRNFDVDRIGKWADGIMLVNTYAHDNIKGLIVDKQNDDGSKAYVEVSGIVGYSFKNLTNETITYMTEEVSFSEEKGEYVGTIVDKQWKPGEVIVLTKLYTTKLLQRPEFSCTCKNAVLRSSVSKSIKEKEQKICEFVELIRQNKLTDSDKEFEEFESLVNEYLEAHYIAYKNRGKSVHDDDVKINISVQTASGCSIAEDKYIKVFGLLNNECGKNKVNNKYIERAKHLQKINELTQTPIGASGGSADTTLVDKIKRRA